MPPESRRPQRPDGRPVDAPPAEAEPRDDTRLSPREQQAIEGAVVPIGRRGNGPHLIVVVVAAALAIGLLRPWDLLAPPRPSVLDPGVLASPPASGAPGPTAPAAPVDVAPDTDPFGPAADGSPTCGYPNSWRSASIQEWAGAYARVLGAAEAVEAAGPDDPTIPFHVLASESVRAIGWCAPVRGDERPPLAAVGTLFRVRDGVATEVPVERREPSQPDALGELWLPRPYRPGRHRPWADGRYVIRLATPTGSYVRYLGLDVGVVRGDETSPVESVAPGLSAEPTSRP